MIDIYVYIIVALLPLAAVMLVVQTNPFHALVIRGILGAVAALVYALLGAADVALTEALMGTLLAITLYAIAVRSSMVMRLGIIEEPESDRDRQFGELIDRLRTIVAKRYLRLELVPYLDAQALHQALNDKEIHAICIKPETIKDSDRKGIETSENALPYQTITRISRLYDIMQSELPSETRLTYVNTSASPSGLSEQHP